MASALRPPAAPGRSAFLLVLLNALIFGLPGCTTLGAPVRGEHVTNLTTDTWTCGALPDKVRGEALAHGLAPKTVIGHSPQRLAPQQQRHLWPPQANNEYIWFSQGTTAFALGPTPTVGGPSTVWPRWFRSFNHRGTAVVDSTLIMFDPLAAKPGYIIRSLPPAPKHPDRLSVLVYNTFFLKPIFADEGAARGPGLIAYLRDHPTPWDVLVLSELFDNDYRPQVIAALASRYPYASKVVGHARERISTGGVVVFSRWPILVEDEVVFGKCIGYDCGAAKGARYVRILKGKRTFHVVATHMQSGSKQRPHRIRMSQAQELAQLAEAQNIARGEPLIFAGDMNVDLLQPGRGRGQGMSQMERILAARPVPAPPGEPCRYSYHPLTNKLGLQYEEAGFMDLAMVARRYPAVATSARIDFPVSKVTATGAPATGYRLLDSCTQARGGSVDLSDHYAVTYTLDFPAAP